MQSLPQGESDRGDVPTSRQENEHLQVVPQCQTNKIQLGNWAMRKAHTVVRQESPPVHNVESPMSPIKEILSEYAEAFEKRFGAKYFVEGTKDAAWAKRLIEMDMMPDEYRRRRDIYFSQERWAEYGAYNFATFVNNINKFYVPQKKVVRIKKYCYKCTSEHFDGEPCRELPPAQPEKMKEILGELTQNLRAN